jgi:hypothetical protein
MGYQTIVSAHASDPNKWQCTYYFTPMDWLCFWNLRQIKNLNILWWHWTGYRNWKSGLINNDSKNLAMHIWTAYCTLSKYRSNIETRLQSII